MNYKEQNDKERNYYRQDFSAAKDFLNTIRKSLISGENIDLDQEKIANLIDYQSEFIYITLFQEFQKPLRFGSARKKLADSLNVCVYNIRNSKRFKDFDISNPDKTRILVEWITQKTNVDIAKIHPDGQFDNERFEPGITGISAVADGKYYNWMPTDSPVNNQMSLLPIYNWFIKKLGLEKEENIVKQLKNVKDIQFFITNSHAIVTAGQDVVPLYRGNILYENFDYEILKKIIINGNNYLCANMSEDGKFMYYYNPKKDDNIDHEHPKRKEPDLYYNDLRHSGGTISLIRAYEITKDKKYLDFAKKSIDWSVKLLQYHQDDNNQPACFPFYNKKGKLGGAGVLLVAIMRYLIITKDNTYNDVIEGLTRHLISRLTPEGEFLGYYIHPSYNEGEPLLSLTQQERQELFSFYYPGEALLGLALFINHYDKNNKLRDIAAEKSKLAMKWIINERPKIYSNLFTKLPSDAWLMQAIEEFSYSKNNILDENAINFVFKDAQTMIDMSYNPDDSPYIDFEGGMFKNFGDHYYLDGARSEGLIAAYYLAKNLGKNDLAQHFLKSCKIAAKNQFQLPVNEFNNFCHFNPEKSYGGIKFKATRQWLRVDGVQHVCCFLSRLYLAEN